jgi:CheY-like chemotaxis protein
VRIKTRLRLNSIILTLLMLLVFFLLRSLGEVATAQQDATLVAEMQRAAFDRTVLREEYVLDREVRAKLQWLAKTEMLGGLLEAAAERWSNPGDIALLADIKRDFEETVAVFEKVVESDVQAETRRLISEEGRKRLIGKILLKSYSLNGLIERLRQSTEGALHAAYNRALLLLFVFITFVILGTIGNTAVLNRLLAKRLARLREGTVIIGSGRLDFRFPLEGGDELSDLAKASNEMAARLQDSHTSINNLQQEVHERRRAKEALRTMAAAMLTHLGFTVIEAEDGVEAVELFRDNRGEFRCVICDLTMPRMNGWETLAALRKLAPGIPVILTSGYDRTTVMEGAHRQRSEAFLHKPYRMAELQSALEAVLKWKPGKKTDR